MNYSLCANLGVPDPPKDSANCGVSTAGNLTTILKSCCNGGPIANYSRGPDEPTYCFQYCNITDPNLSYLDVQNCILGQMRAQNFTGPLQALDISCGPAANKTSSASKGRVNKLVWTLLGLVVVQAVL